MKKRSVTQRLLAAQALCFCLSLLLPGCGKREEAVSSAPVSSQSSLSQAPAPEGSAPEADSQPENINAPEEGQSGLVIDIETDSPEFDEKFKDNPIDKAYIADSIEAVSNVEMVELCDKYAQIWENEINVGMEKLLALATDDKELYQKQQEDWETGKQESLQRINDQAGEGSLAAVSAASERMDFYRTRANQVLRELYSYDPDYAYASCSS